MAGGGGNRPGRFHNNRFRRNGRRVETNSTGSGFTDKAEKPNKPHADFPLFAHAASMWAKKLSGKLFYFGPWGDPDGALKKYLSQKDDLRGPYTPR